MKNIKFVSNNKHEKSHVFKFTTIYFSLLIFSITLIESCSESSPWITYWHFVTNIVNLIVLATTIFLITLNNPISIEIKRENIKTYLVHNLFSLAAYTITIVSPITVINQYTLQSIYKFIENLLSNHLHHFYCSFWEIIAILLSWIVLSSLYLTAKSFNTQHADDDKEIERYVTKKKN